MVMDRVVQIGREHPSRKSRKTALDFQGQTASAQAVRLSLERSFVGVLALVSRGDRVGTPRWPGVSDPAGVEEQGQSTRGVPRKLGAPSVSIDISGSGTGTPISPCPRPRDPGRWEQNRRKGGIAKRRQRSAARGADGSRSAS